MFKKTLLALAIAGTAVSANAGVLSVDFKEGADTAAGAVVAAIAPSVNGCAQAVTALGVTPVLGGFTPDNAAVNDTLTVTVTKNGIYSAASSVTYTGTDACTVVVADELVDADTAKYSLEGATAKGVTINATQIAGIGGYTEEDTITFTVTGGTVNEAASLGAKLESYGTDGVPGAGASNGDFTLLGVVGNKILFSVDTGYTGAAREALRLTGVVVTPDANASEIKVSSEVQNTANVMYDVTAAAKLANLAKQYTADVHVLADGIVDVQTERFNFESNDKDAGNTFLDTDKDGLTSDTFVVKVTENTSLGNLTPKSGSLVIKGDFSWLQDYAGADGVLSSAEIATAVSYSTWRTLTAGVKTTAGDDAIGTLVLNTAKNELTVPVTVGADTDVDAYHSFTFKVKGKDATPAPTVALAETPFSASLNFINDKAADSTSADVALNVVTDANVGKWELNGSVVNVPYIPFGPNTQPVIRHTNKGVQTGDISLRYMVEGSSGNTETNTWKSLGVIVEDAKPGVRDLLAVVTEKLTTELGTDKFKVALEFTTNVPKEDVTVFAAAKVTAEGQDRLTIGAFSGN